MILDAYYDALRSLLASADPGKRITHIGFGVGLVSVQPSDTALTAAYTKPLTSVERDAVDPRRLRCHYRLERGEAVGLAISEIGLLTADGTLIARKVRSPIEKTADLELGDYWEIQV